VTAPLPPLPPEVERALDDLVDRLLEIGRDPMRVVEGAEARTALVRAIARALGGDGAPVAWGVVDRNRNVVELHYHRHRDVADGAVANFNLAVPGYAPFTVVPLYTRPAATGDTGEGERAKVAAWEAAHDSLRDDVLHNADGFDNDIVNHYLGMIDDADQRPYTHIAATGAEVERAVADEREAIAAWHDAEADRITRECAESRRVVRENPAAFAGINTSLEHEEAQAETHRECAAAIRARGVKS